MKIKLFIVLVLSIVSLNAFSQAKKPTIMVVPSDTWCKSNGFMMNYDNQGTIKPIPDYSKAIINSTELLGVISKINELMAERGFPLKDMESSIKSLESQSARDAMLTSKTGAGKSENPIDKLNQTAKADIIIQLTWFLHQSGPKKSVEFILQGKDAYTDKQIAGASGTGAPSFSAEISVLLQEAVLAHLDNFNSQLQKHFDDLFENGREVKLRITKFDSFSGDLESEFEGKELGEIIEEWITANTVKSRYNTTNATENEMLFEQVRIPLYDINNKAVDTRSWARDLQKILRDKYQITAKLMTIGLGQVELVIGEK